LNIVKPKWLKRCLESFERLDTKPDEWSECEITGRYIDKKGIEYYTYRIYGGYKEVTPHYDKLTQLERDALIRERQSNKDTSHLIRHDTCQLCGHGIMSPRRIKHDDKEFVMSIGSECVKNYTKIGTAKHTLKMQEEKEIKEMYLEWKNIAYRYIWNESKFKKFYKKYGRSGLEKRYHNFQRKLRELDPEILSSSKIIGIFRWANNNSIPVPDKISKILEKRARNYC